MKETMAISNQFTPADLGVDATEAVDVSVTRDSMMAGPRIWLG
jgi:hypothetical protein